MSELLGTTVQDLIATMKERRVRIPSEIGAFIALEVCESLASGPAAVRGVDVRIADDGSISVFAPPGSATSEHAARSVVAMLGSLLVAAGTGVPRVLVGLLEEGPSSGRWDLSSLRDDLEASLVPLNRAAARRVLSRMLREARKPRSSAPAPSRSSAAPPPGDPTLDAQLDDLLGDAGGRPKSAPPPKLADLDADLDATLSELDDMAPAPPVDPFASSRPPPTAAPRAPSRPSSPRPAHQLEADATIAEDSPPSFAASTPQPTAPPRREGPGPAEPTGLDLDALGDELDAGKRSSVLPWVLALVAILAATVASVALLRPDLVDAMLGRPPPPPEPEGPTEAEREAERLAAMGRFGVLTIQANPGESQVLMFVGRGPAEAVELPVGVAHEFVAIAEGRAPTRSYIPADGEWEELEGGGRRYELAMQAGQDEMAEADLDLGPTTLPRDALGSPQGPLGTARVVTNPPGAKVYLLIGFSPTVSIENMPTEEVIELLVYHEGHPVSTVTVSPSDWESTPDGTKRAQVRVTLEGAEEEEP